MFKIHTDRAPVTNDIIQQKQAQLVLTKIIRDITLNQPGPRALKQLLIKRPLPFEQKQHTAGDELVGIFVSPDGLEEVVDLQWVLEDPSLGRLESCIQQTRPVWTLLHEHR